MKKAILLLILSVFLISIFAIAVSAPDPDVWFGTAKKTNAAKTTPSQLFTGGVKSFITSLESILGAILGAVSKTPDIWLRLMFFIAIYAILFKILEMKALAGFLDRKTAAILGFVVSFATVAVMPGAWLMLTVYMYGGLVMIFAMAIPLIWGAVKTKDALATKPSKLEMLLMIIGWIMYILIISTVYSTFENTYGAGTLGTLLGWFMAIAPFVAGVAILVIIYLWVTGKGEKEITAKQIRQEGLWDTFFGKSSEGKEEDKFDKIIDEAENVADNLQSAKANAHSANQLMLETTLSNVEQALGIVIKEYSFLEKMIDKAKSLGEDAADRQANSRNLREIKTGNSQIQTVISASLNKIKHPSSSGIEFDVIETHLNSVVGIGTAIVTKIKEIEKVYDKVKKAAARTSP